ncbi:Conserved_hypothetical protein [Hexamita inflata]|uniref:Uncharacterized protein n=1 Tax=Hexamita inflata TaxID=28002 RepID=A0ABP1ME37_9EUKA
MYMLFCYCVQLECVDIHDSTQLKGIKSEYNIYLSLQINQNCNIYIGQQITASINFANIIFPYSMNIVSQMLQTTGIIEIKFSLDELTYKLIKQISFADFTIFIGQEYQFHGTITNIQHKTVDISNCWDQVTFSADRDWAFNVSVQPLNCKIASKIQVYLEYYNITWISIPIIPSTSTQFPYLKQQEHNRQSQVVTKIELECFMLTIKLLIQMNQSNITIYCFTKFRISKERCQQVFTILEQPKNLAQLILSISGIQIMCACNFS